MQTRVMMQHTSETISDVMELIAASHTKETQRKFHKTIIKNIMAKQDMWWNDSLHGSNVVFTELQSDTRRNVTTILDLFILHQF